MLMPVALAVSPAPPPPDGVVAVAMSPEEVLLSWLPVPDATYRVYGVTSAGAVLLEETTDLSARVPSDFPMYGVAAVVGGQQGETAYATPWCVTLNPGGWPPVVITECRGSGIVSLRDLP